MLRFEMVQYQRTDEQKKLMRPDDIDMSVKVSKLFRNCFLFLKS